MKKLNVINSHLMINSEDLRRRFKDVKKIVHQQGNVAIIVNNRVDMVLLDVDIYNQLVEQADE